MMSKEDLTKINNSSSKFSMIILIFILALQPFAILLNYLSCTYPQYFYREFNGPTNFTLVFFLDKICVIAVCIPAYAIARACNRLLLVYITIVALCVFYLEAYTYSLPKYMGFFQFLILHNFSKSFALFSKIKYSIIASFNVVIYAYVFVRIIILIKTESAFPVPYSIFLFFNFIICEFPYNFTIKMLRQFMQNQINMLEDFQIIIELFPNPIIIYNQARNTIIFANKVAVSSFKCIESIMQLLDSSGFSKDLADKHSQFNNRFYDLKSSLLKTSTSNERFYAISINDVTEIANNEKKIASENAQWLFVNTANHQIRTPLSGIESSLMLLQTAIKESIDKKIILKQLDITVLSVISLRHLVDDTLLFCEDKSNNIALNKQPFKLEEIGTEMKKLFEFETYSKKIILQIENPLSLFYIISDKKRIFHIIYTLLSNAFKYTVSGIIKYSHKATLTNNRAEVTITVSDTGTGMSHEETKNLFKIFDNSKEKKMDSKVASGISLYVIKRLIELMDGKIEITSEQNKGTIFIITFNADINVSYSAVKEKRKILDSPSSPISSPESKKCNVLVVDDSATNLFVIVSMLKRLSIKCEEAHNGQEAVEMYNSFNYRLILMDINMPIMNGYDASKKIKVKADSSFAQVRIVALSAQDEPQKEDMLISNGINDWVVKPMTMKMLKSILQEENMLNE